MSDLEQTGHTESGPAGSRMYRILLGTTEIAGQLPDFADGFRQLGHQVTTAISHWNPFNLDLKYDVDLTKGVPWPEWVVSSTSPLVRLPRGAAGWAYYSVRGARLMKLIAQHDVFMFQWGGFSLTAGNREYPLLKKLGKRIVSVFNGDDIRHASAYDQQFSRAGLTKNSWGELCEFKDDPLTRPLKNVRLGERHADLILAVPNFAGLCVRPYMHFFVPINLSKYECRVVSRDIPVVVHAPSSKGVKGTSIVLAALERLRAEGVRFELRLLHGVSNREVIAALTDSDVAIEQLHIPLHGKFGVEAMATGCALATCNREEYEPMPPNRPVWHVGPENTYEQLRRLLTDKGLRGRLAREGREYVERHHDHVTVARRILECLDADGLDRYGHYPTFFARHYLLPEGVEVPRGIKRMTAEVVRRWGLPEGVDPRDIIARGLMSAEGAGPLGSIPRWKLAPTLTREGWA